MHVVAESQSWRSFTRQILRSSSPIRQILTVTIFSSAFLFAVPESAWTGCVDYAEGPKEVGQLELSANPLDLIAEGDLLYVCASTRFYVLDNADPMSPSVMGETSVYDYGRDVAVAGDFAYVAVDDEGLQIIDISDPNDPTTVGWIVTPGAAYDVALFENYAFVAAGPANTLEIVDVSNPAAPWIVDSFDVQGRANAVEIVDGIACVAASQAGLVILDVTNPIAPEILGIAETTGNTLEVVVSGTHAFLTVSDGFAVADIADPTNPSFVGDVWMDDPRDISLAGSYAIASDGVSGVKMIDVSYPSSPRIVGAVGLGGRTDGVAISGDFAYSANNVLRIVDISNPVSPLPVGMIDTGDDTHGVSVAEPYVYVTDSHTGFQIIDVSDPTIPSVVGDIPYLQQGLDVAVAGPYAYFCGAGLNGFRVIDVSDASDPEIVGYEPMNWAYAVTVRGSNAYVADHSNHLKIVDVTDPTDPTMVGEVPIGAMDGGTGPHSVSVSGDYAYLVDCMGDLYIASIADVENPEVVSVLRNVGGYGVVAREDYAYVCGLSVVDISDPGNPVIVGSANAAGVYLAVQGDYVYLSSYTQGMKVVDISDPADPFVVGSIPTPDEAFRVAVNDHYTFIADETAGLIIAPIQCAPAAIDPIPATTTPRLLLPAVPHPIHTDATVRFALPSEGPVRIWITDPAGRRIRRLLDGTVEAGRHLLDWDGRDDLGRPAASGVYFLHLSWKDRTEGQRLVLLR
jgi:hypothetical protein